MEAFDKWYVCTFGNCLDASSAIINFDKECEKIAREMIRLRDGILVAQNSLASEISSINDKVNDFNNAKMRTELLKSELDCLKSKCLRVEDCAQIEQ
jgi:hypothetical protein